MSSSKDILSQKASETESLKNTIGSGIDESSKVTSDKPTTIINEDGKKVLVFKDPLYSREKRSIVNYTIFKGKWQFENLDDIDDTEPEKCAVKFTSLGSETGEFTIVFKSLKDRVEFMDSIYSDQEMRQVGSGMSLEKLANSKVFKTTGGLIGLSIASYGIYKLLGGKKKE